MIAHCLRDIGCFPLLQIQEIVVDSVFHDYLDEFDFVFLADSVDPGEGLEVNDVRIIGSV